MPFGLNTGLRGINTTQPFVIHMYYAVKTHGVSKRSCMRDSSCMHARLVIMRARLVTMHARLVCHGSRDIHAELVGVEIVIGLVFVVLVP